MKSRIKLTIVAESDGFLFTAPLHPGWGRYGERIQFFVPDWRLSSLSFKALAFWLKIYGFELHTLSKPKRGPSGVYGERQGHVVVTERQDGWGVREYADGSWLYDSDHNPLRLATEEEACFSFFTDEGPGIIPVDGVECYVDRPPHGTPF